MHPRHPTAERVLDAAAQLVAAGGVETLSLFALQVRSGVSTGSIYHHFGSRDGVVTGLIRRSYRDWRRALITTLGEHADDPAAAVTAAVAVRLQWGEERPGEARLVLNHRGSLLAAPMVPEPQALTRAFGDWLRRQADEHGLATVDADVGLAIAFGPAHDLLRSWLDRPGEPGPAMRAGELGDAAWAGLRAAGATSGPAAG